MPMAIGIVNGGSPKIGTINHAQRVLNIHPLNIDENIHELKNPRTNNSAISISFSVLLPISIEVYGPSLTRAGLRCLRFSIREFVLERMNHVVGLLDGHHVNAIIAVHSLL